MNIICFDDPNTYGYDPRSWLDGRYNADSCRADLLATETSWTIRPAWGSMAWRFPEQPQTFHPTRIC